MALIKICLIQFLNGFKDSLFGFVTFIQKQKVLNQQGQLANNSNNNNNNKYELKKPSASSSLSSSSKSKKASSDEKLFQRLVQSCILNGIFLFLCIIIFNYILVPLLNLIAFKLISSEKHSLITDYLNPTIQLLFSFVWILPVFLLSKIFNVFCHQEIADIAYVKKYGKPQIYKNARIADVIADTIFSCTMELIFLVQSSFVSLVPSLWLNKMLCHVHLAFLYSLYAFEYKFCNMGWDIKKRISHIEARWPYYFGFGLSLSLILSIANSYFYNATLFAFIFPAFILSAIEADSEKLSSIVYFKYDVNYVDGMKQVPLTMPLFRVAISITDFLFKAFARKTPNSKAKAATSSQAVASHSNATRHAQAPFTIRKTN
jgi:etoposide-induced 2.4 mRNA